MDVRTIPRQEKSQVELKISVPASDFKPYIERAASGLTKNNPLKGFRPGKAPVTAVAAALGQERVLKEAMEKALPKFFVQAVIEESVEAISKPSVTIGKLGLDEPFEFTAIVDVVPEVKIGPVKKLAAQRNQVAVQDADVKKELEHLAKTRAKLLDVARPAEPGDTVTIDFDVKINGVTIEGGASKNHPVELGTGHFVPGFEDKLTGIQAGDTREFVIDFPDDFPREEFAGKKANVYVKAHSVQKKVLPKIDDEFAKGLGKFTSLSELKKQLKEDIQQERELKEQERVRGKLMEQLAETAEFGFIPEILVEREIDRRIREFEQMLAMQQKTVEQYLQSQGKTLAQLRSDMRGSAEKNVRVGLALKAFAAQENIKVAPEEIEAKIQEYAGQFPNPEEARQHLDMEALREEVGAVLRNQKTLEKLEEMTMTPSPRQSGGSPL